MPDRKIRGGLRCKNEIDWFARGQVAMFTNDLGVAGSQSTFRSVPVGGRWLSGLRRLAKRKTVNKETRLSVRSRTVSGSVCVVSVKTKTRSFWVFFKVCLPPFWFKVTAVPVRVLVVDRVYIKIRKTFPLVELVELKSIAANSEKVVFLCAGRGIF